MAHKKVGLISFLFLLIHINGAAIEVGCDIIALTFHTRAATGGPSLGEISPEWDKSVTFFKISFQLILELKTDLKT